MKHPKKNILLSVVLFLASGSLQATDRSNPHTVVEQLHETLLQTMIQSNQLGYDGRCNLLSSVVEDSFDFDTIARVVTGRHWEKLGVSERDRFKRLFRKLSTATYATNFSAFSGEHFETIGAEKRRGGTIVKTALVKSNGEQISINYLLRKADNKWLIVNVIAKGVSDLSLKRADYTAVLSKEGFNSLMERLNDKITMLARQ